MLQHIVLIKTKNKKKIQNLLKSIKNLPNKIPGLINIKIKEDINGRSLNYNIVIISDFKDKKSLNIWTYHPKHFLIKKKLRSFSQLLIFDYEIK